jgi:hypothetical protein
MMLAVPCVCNDNKSSEGALFGLICGWIGGVIAQCYLIVTLLIFTYTPKFGIADFENLTPLNECADEYT